jgi:alpha-mannosidase
LSRDDFPTRKGHAGPRLPTPGAQMIGSHVFAYALIPYASGPGQPSARSQAEAFNAPLRGVAVGLHAGDLPPAAHLLRCSPASFRISAIKSAEDGAGWIVRGYNNSADPLQATLWSWKPFSKVERTNLAEKPLETLSLQANGTVSFPVGGHQIVTLKFSSEQEGASQSS